MQDARVSRQTVAAVIPTKNSAKLIAGALDSLWFCDEVIVVDMHSTDSTRAICESYSNVRLIEREGYIYGNVNFGIDQSVSDWIIRLDSDERLSPDLQQEIIQLLHNTPPFDVYAAPFTSYFVGYPMRHGSAFELTRRITLFRRPLLRYAVRSEHEDFSPVSGTMPSRGELQHPYFHFSVPSISKYLKKIEYYAARDFERASPAELRVSPPWRVSVSMFRYFARLYFTNRGYKDGYHGFALAALDTIYMFVQQLMTWEMKEGLKELHDTTRERYDAMLREERTRRTLAAETAKLSAFRGAASVDLDDR